MKTHLNLSTSNLDRSVSFYSTLLDAQPVKVLSDYALFVTEQPGLELALDLREVVSPANDAHYGIYVDAPREVERAIDRLSAAGLAETVERTDSDRFQLRSHSFATRFPPEQESPIARFSADMNEAENRECL